MRPVPKSDPEAVPRIPARTDEGARPFWSVMIPTYNRFEYLAETLASIFSQDPGPANMQIAVVDDCSTAADPEVILRELDPDGRVELIRLDRHVSIASAWNACIAHARGRWVHIMHSDDCLLPGFYSTLTAALGAHPEVGFAFSRAVWMDDNGNWTALGPLEQAKPGFLKPEALDRLAISNRIQCPAVVVRRDVYEALGGYRTDLGYTLDWEMWQRIALLHPVWYQPTPLICWRDHSGSETQRLLRTDGTFRDIRKCIEIVRESLPPERAWLSKRALADCGFEQVWHARRLLEAGRYRDALRSIRVAFGYACSIKMVTTLLKTIVWFPLFLISRAIRRK